MTTKHKVLHVRLPTEHDEIIGSTKITYAHTYGSTTPFPRIDK